MAAIGSRIQSQVQSELDRTQREYVLRQQLKAIQEELGERDPAEAEVDELREQLAAIDAARGRAHARPTASSRGSRSCRRPPPSTASSAPTSSGSRRCPGTSSTEDNLDLAHAREVLDADHYDIEHVKDRILEFLAVRKLKPDARGSILCFVGPPGVGKTSLGPVDRARARAASSSASAPAACATRPRSAATAAPTSARCPGRSSARCATPGSANPLFMIDEIDKMGSDYRGDPASAMLEVLDPEQNATFRDHYLDVPFDLSQRHVHHHGEHARHGPGPAARPHGGDPARRLHRGGEAPDRQALPRPAPDRAQRAEALADRVLRRRAEGDHRRAHARGRRAQPRARDRRGLPQGRAPRGRGPARSAR